jgi:hypothetical protein
MSPDSIPSVEDIPFDVSPALRALLSEVLARLATVEEENRQLKEEVREASRGEQTARFCAQQLHARIMTLEEGLPKVEKELFNHSLLGHPDMRLDIDALQESPAPGPSSYPTPSGRKTAARIEDLKSRLKRRRGRATFTEMREEMGLSKSQFSKLAGRLDKRIFDIQRHPTKAREKLLILRQQIGS